MTALLNRWSSGDRAAAERVLPHVYEQLRAVAGRCFREERPGHTLQPTALVHEVYLEVGRSADLRFCSRGQFFALAACLMRRALVDHSRRRNAEKRGGGRPHLPLAAAFDVACVRPSELLALDRALDGLAALDRHQALVVELRFFGGLTVAEVAATTGRSPRSVARDWRMARAYLFQELAPEDAA